MKAWVLSRVSYPTGGFTDFDFESNRYTQNGTVKLAGGLRISQIRSYTAVNGTTLNEVPITKTYRYGQGELGWGTFRSNLQLTYAATQRQNYYTLGYKYNYTTTIYSSAPTYPLSPNEGSAVTYPVVTEYEDDGTGLLGKTVYQFRDANSDLVIRHPLSSATFVKSRHWDRGQLVSKQLTDRFGNLRYREEHDYQTLVSGETSEIAGMLVARSLRQLAVTVIQSGCYTIGNEYNPYLKYSFEYGLTQRIRTRQYMYPDDNNVNRYSLKITETDYDPTFYLPRETRLFAEGGIVLGTQFSYPQDFGHNVPQTSATPEVAGMGALQERNVYQAIEEIQYRQESVGAPKAYKTGKLTTYTPTTLNGLPTALPYRSYRLESLFDSFPANNPYRSSAQRYVASGSTSSFPVDPRMALRLTMTNYDAYGNLTRYALTNGAAATFGYDTYSPAGGVLFSVVNRQTLNADQANAQSSTYTYTRPLLGPNTTTDARGVTTTYVYDAFGRLATIKDKDGNVLKQYSYHYATQP